MYSNKKPMIVVVISVLVVALVYSSISAFNVFAAQRGEAPSDADCETNVFIDVTTCCWTETDPADPEGIELHYCQTCSTNGCNPKTPDKRPEGPTRPPTGPAAPLQGGVLEQPPTPPPGPAAPLQDGVLEQQEPPTPPTFAPGFLQQQEQPTDQGLTEEAVPQEAEPPEPTCPEGQVLDEETNLCVLEEPEADEPQQQEPEEEPSSEEEEEGNES